MTDQLITTILGGGTTGIIAGLILVLYLLITEKLVVGGLYRRMEAKLTRYEDVAFKAMEVAERAQRKDE